MFPTSYMPTQFKSYLPFIPTVALVFGFFFDLLTLNQPDALFENVVIVGYLLISAAAMLLLQMQKDTERTNKRLLLLSIVQFSFGNLASALMILYAYSGTFTGSAIFVGMLASLLLGNELFRKRYARTHLRVTIWFVLLLTYSGLVVPILLNKIGAFVFLVSALLALIIAYAYVQILSFVTKESFERAQRNIIITLFAITLVFSGLYFSNLIPPVPLSLKHIGIYHSVVRIGENYTATFEAPRWFEFWRDTKSSFEYTAIGSPVFCFSSVYAPTRLATDIRHRWEKYNEVTEEWITVARIPFSITGGRKDGFRGYTQTSQIDAGLWRCSVETARGTLIGRSTFEVIQTDIPAITRTIGL